MRIKKKNVWRKLMSMKCVCVDKRLKWPPFRFEYNKISVLIDSRQIFQIEITKIRLIKWIDLSI